MVCLKQIRAPARQINDLSRNLFCIKIRFNNFNHSLKLYLFNLNFRYPKIGMNISLTPVVYVRRVVYSLLYFLHFYWIPFLFIIIVIFTEEFLSHSWKFQIGQILYAKAKRITLGSIWTLFIDILFLDLYKCMEFFNNFINLIVNDMCVLPFCQKEFILVHFNTK